MRIGIGQIWQETNTFNPRRTTRADFEQFGVLRGADIESQMADTNELGGFIQSLPRLARVSRDCRPVRLPAWSSGPATAETFAWMRDELFAALAAAPPLDGVLLALHGSLVAEGHPDVEGACWPKCDGRSVRMFRWWPRSTCTPTSPSKWRTVPSALVLFHTAPHIDVFETGQRGQTIAANPTRQHTP